MINYLLIWEDNISGTQYETFEERTNLFERIDEINYRCENGVVVTDPCIQIFSCTNLFYGAE